MAGWRSHGQNARRGGGPPWRSCRVWPWRTGSGAGEGFHWPSLRVARWVANRCLPASFCVVPRCSPSVSLLVCCIRAGQRKCLGFMACKRSAVRARLAPQAGQKPNSNRSNRRYSRKVQRRRPDGPPYVYSDRIPSPTRAAGSAAHVLRRSGARSLSPGQIRSLWSCDRCRVATVRHRRTARSP